MTANEREGSLMSEAKAVVFVVDDDATMRETLKNLIRSVGLRVEVFASAQEFLRSKLTDVPGCLVLDVRLPGLSGLDLQKRMADAGMEIPIIFITGHGDIPMTVRAMKAGAVEFLTKPFRDQDLLDAIQQALERDRTMREQQGEIVELRSRFDSLTPRSEK
jgi:FixJ family two-component response regulator